MDLKPPGPTPFITVPEAAWQEYEAPSSEDSKFRAKTTRTSCITVPEPEQVKSMIGMQLAGLISSIDVMQTEIEILKGSLLMTTFGCPSLPHPPLLLLKNFRLKMLLNLKRGSPPGRPREASSCWSLLPKSLLRPPRPPLALVGSLKNSTCRSSGYQG